MRSISRRSRRCETSAILLLVVMASVVLLPSKNLSAQNRQSSLSEPTRGGPGGMTIAIIALLQHGQDRCSRVGQRLLTYWRQLEGDADHIQQSLERYMLTRTSADLAGARKALDLARGLLTRAGSEVNAVRREALEQLYEVDTTLCRLVAQPTPPMENFHQRVDLAESHIEQALGKLGNLVAFPERKKFIQKLEPFQAKIDAASDEARDQVKKELEVRRPEQLPPTSYHLMQTWHRGYEKSVMSSKSALRDYRDSRAVNDAPAIQQACKNLLEAVIPLLARDEVFRAPDRALEVPLRAVYKAMRRLGNRCTAGRFVEADRAYEWLESSLDEAATILATYSLEP